MKIIQIIKVQTVLGRVYSPSFIVDLLLIADRILKVI